MLYEFYSLCNDDVIMTDNELAAMIKKLNEIDLKKEYEKTLSNIFNSVGNFDTNISIINDIMCCSPTNLSNLDKWRFEARKNGRYFRGLDIPHNDKIYSVTSECIELHTSSRIVKTVYVKIIHEGVNGSYSKFSKSILLEDYEFVKDIIIKDGLETLKDYLYENMKEPHRDNIVRLLNHLPEDIGDVTRLDIDIDRTTRYDIDGCQYYVTNSYIFGDLNVILNMNEYAKLKMNQ